MFHGIVTFPKLKDMPVSHTSIQGFEPSATNREYLFEELVPGGRLEQEQH